MRRGASFSCSVLSLSHWTIFIFLRGKFPIFYWMRLESRPQSPQRFRQKKAVLWKKWSLRMKRNAQRKWSKIRLITNQVAIKCNSNFTVDKLMNKWPVTFFAGFLGLHCSRNWDGWLCWEDTAAGTHASQNCPNYFGDFDPTGGRRDFAALLLSCYPGKTNSPLIICWP